MLIGFRLDYLLGFCKIVCLLIVWGDFNAIRMMATASQDEGRRDLLNWSDFVRLYVHFWWYASTNVSACCVLLYCRMWSVRDASPCKPIHFRCLIHNKLFCLIYTTYFKCIVIVARLWKCMGLSLFLFWMCSTTVFSHSQTVVLCGSCATVLCQPTGGRARLTEGCSFRKKGD